VALVGLVAPAPPLDSDAAAIPATELSGTAAGFFFVLSAVGAFVFFLVGFDFFFCFFFGLAGAAVAAAPPARLRFFPLSRTQSRCWLFALQKPTLSPMHRFHLPLTLRGQKQRNVQLFLPCWPPRCPLLHGMQLCDTIGEGAAGSAAASRGRLGSAAFTSSAGAARFAIATRPCVAGSWRRRCQLWVGRGWSSSRHNSKL
jgi:hypothetical protein